jgi:hypothetical protein
MQKKAKWTRNLSKKAWVNNIAITDDGSRVVCGTFIHRYWGKGGKKLLSSRPNRHGTFGIYAYDSKGERLWKDTYVGWDGVFAVGISGDGQVAAAGGWYDKKRGLMRIYDGNNGHLQFDFQDKKLKRVSIISISRDGGVVAAAANNLYVFVRKAGAYVLADHPDFSNAFEGKVTAVAVHPSGSWLVACDKQGNVLLATISGGVVKRTWRWTARKEPIDPTKPASKKVPVPFLSIQVARRSDAFAVGGGNVVYLFTRSGFRKKKPTRKYNTSRQLVPGQRTPKGNTLRDTPAENVRWLAISDDGKFISTVVNRETRGAKTGLVLAYKRNASPPAWKVAVTHNPNGTSVDGAAKYVAVADGFCKAASVKPPDPPGKACDSAFYLFDAKGKKVWEFPTLNMNWPIFFSADGRAVAAGGDDGRLYYFEP